MCPLHDRLYDLRTGAQIAGDCTIRRYPVQVTQSGEIVLTLTADAAELAEAGAAGS